MKKEETTSLFHLSFVGELVEILMPLYRKNVQGNEEGIMDQTIPIVVQGYILDADDEFLYLGDTPEEITKGIKREDVRYIEVIKEANPYDEVLDNMPTPNGKNGAN